MSDASRQQYLRIALIVVGVIFTFGIYPVSILWPSGWTWGQGHSHYLPMILGVYATLGIFLIMASRDPARNTSLIWFTVWSSVVHALVIAVQAVVNTEHLGHLVGDVPFLLVAAAVLALLTPRGTKRAALEQGAV